ATPARRAAPAPAPAATPAATRGGGSTVQLGAFGSEAIANAAWKRMAARFAFLAPLTPNVTQATVNGKVYYRLQASAPGQARDICGRLKVAGESCIVVGN
ncbi:SPOR domain-containing protein, partial [Sphingomonas flavalba]|uniref:SPOR domain-containing protein n=1 Tax=Sphingomonas flavalba TaxID=2559804 RepID=UPI00109D85C0